MYEKFCTFFQTLNNNNLVDEESTTVSPHLKELRIKSTTSVPPFEHDLAATVVSHEINRSAAHYATTTRPYLSQLRAKCEKKYEKDQHHILKSLEVAKVDHDDKKSQSNKEDTGTDDDLESNDNHIVSLKISKKVQFFFFETTFDPKDKINIFWK